MATTPATTKPGYKTTEFWLTLLMHLVTALLLSGAFPDTHMVVKAATLVASVLAQLGYTAARVRLKE